MNEDTAPDPEDELQSRAFNRKSFLGQPLEEFSFARNTAAQRLGMSSDSMLEASALVVFLCLQSEEVVDEARDAGVKPFRRMLNRWADANKIGLHTPNGKLVRRIATEIWEEMAASDTEPILKTTKGPAGPKAPRRAQKRNTLPASRPSSKAV